MNNRFSAVVLDFDGTVGDTEFSIISTAQSTLAALHLPPVPDSSIKALIGVPLRDVFGALSGNHDDEFLDFAASTYRRIYVEENSIAKVTLFPEVASTLSALHAAGVFLAIASSRGHASLEMITEHLGINGFIGMIVGAEDVPKSKPAPTWSLKSLIPILSIPMLPWWLATRLSISRWVIPQAAALAAFPTAIILSRD
jgi:phosphoglycolate phosphatase